MTLEGKYQDWESDPGKHLFLFSDGTRSSTRLNEVNWESYALAVGIRCRF
jgi:hypothetical protein